MFYFQLLCEDRFHTIDKIKTVGSTYMAAVGLIPEYKIIPSDPHSPRRLMTALIEFVRAMRVTLKNINDNSYNNFMLRVGVNVGSVVAGVIGARKPQYDIWGNTVNVASRMDSTGIPGYTQVTQEVVDSLQGSHFEFKCRGQIKVKGKGDMVTYFLCDNKPTNVLGTEPAGMHQPIHFHNNENANYQGNQINKDNFMKKKNFGNILEDNHAQYQHPIPVRFNIPSNVDKSVAIGNYNGVNLTENLNYVKREYDNYSKAININNHFNINNYSSINNYNIHGQQHIQHHQPSLPILPTHQNYNIRENFNIIENPSEKQGAVGINYLDRDAGGSAGIGPHNSNYNIMHQRKDNEHEPLLTNPNPMPKVLYRAEQTSKYEPPQYIGVPFQRQVMTDQRYKQQQQQQHPMKKQTNSNPMRYHHNSNNNNNPSEIYMKPLPKLPANPHNEFNESREMSSTDDLSHSVSDRRNSLSVSSSDESYSKTTDDCDRSNIKMMPKNDQKRYLMRPLLNEQQMLAQRASAGSPGIDLKDFEMSSTTDHTVSTIPNRGESCNSFEYEPKGKTNYFYLMIQFL